MDTSSNDFILGLNAREFALYVGLVITLIGWFVNNKSANKRENRKECRAEVDACCKLAADLFDKAKAYYSSIPKAEDRPVAAEIRFNVQRLFIRVERLQERHQKFEVIGACEEMLDSITGDSFESANRKAINLSDVLIIKIENDVHFLMDQLELGFYKTFY